jgi:hypothetical protein
MVVDPRLVVSLPVAQVELPHNAFSLESGDGPKHRRVVGAAKPLPDLLVQLIDGPGVLVVALDQGPHGIGYRTWPRHASNCIAIDLRKSLVQ